MSRKKAKIGQKLTKPCDVKPYTEVELKIAGVQSNRGILTRKDQKGSDVSDSTAVNEKVSGLMSRERKDKNDSLRKRMETGELNETGRTYFEAVSKGKLTRTIYELIKLKYGSRKNEVRSLPVTYRSISYCETRLPIIVGSRLDRFCVERVYMLVATYETLLPALTGWNQRSVWCSHL